MSEPEVLFEVRGKAGVITLNRPGALNALTLGMVRAMHPQLEAWAGDSEVDLVIVKAAGEKAFCAGGDIRALYDWGLARDQTFLAFYEEEYKLNTFIKRYPKPYIALLDGITMGGGVGVSVHGSHRVVTERLTFAMPETGIGLFPDVGGTYFLPRCPGEIGMFMGLTGHRLKAADACYAGIATHFTPSDRLGDIETALIGGVDPGSVLQAMCADPGAAPLAELRPAIDRHFSLPGVDAILDSLDAEGTEWAQKTAQIMRSKSPTSQRITFRQIRAGRELEFEDCMRLEYRMVNGIYRGADFFEGIRAVVVDKDQEPGWKPATLAEVSDAAVDTYFAPLERELDV